MLLPQLMLFQSSTDLNDKILIGFISLITGIILALLGKYLARDKTQSEIDKTNSETEKIRNEEIASLRKQLADAQNQKIEVLDKLDVWIGRFEDAKEQWNQTDDELNDALARLGDCLESKDEKCQKCMRRVIKLIEKIERSLIGSADHQNLLEEMSILKQDLEGETAHE